MASPAIPDPLLVAEDISAYRVPWATQERLDAGDVVLFHAPIPSLRGANASRIRFDGTTVERRVHDVREWFAARGRDRFVWSIGASATPSDLVARLLASGAEPRPYDPITVPTVLEREPPRGPSGIVVRRVDTFEDYELAWSVDLEGSDVPENVRRQWRARLAADWPHFRADAHQIAYLASIDGAAIAYALLALPTTGPPYLAGAATVPSARRRGAYRALVRARWEEALRLGSRSVIAQAGPESHPILERLGFVAGPPIHHLVDLSQPPRGSTA